MSAQTETLILAAIGASITGARSVGKPDPTDDELTLDLSAAGIAAIDIRDNLPRLKQLALETMRDVLALASLASFVTTAMLWAGILRGVI